MSKSKLSYFLSKISSKDLAIFKNHLEQSKSKKDQSLGRLLDMIIKGKEDNHEIGKKLYKDKVVSEKQVRNLRSELLNKLIDFLAVRLFEDSPEKTLFVAEALNRIQATKYFPAILEKHASQKQKAGFSLDQLEINMRLQAQKIAYQLTEQGRKRQQYETLVHASEEVFIARTLYYAIAHQVAQGLWEPQKSEPPIQLWNSLRSKLEKGAWADSILIQSYWSLYKLVRFPQDGSHFLQVKRLLSTYGKQFSKEEANRMYSVAINHCIHSLNNGQKPYNEELFQLYQEMRKRDLMLTDEGINAWSFKAIVNCGARLRHFLWTRTFINEYQKYLRVEYKKSVLNYCEGILAFYQKNFELGEKKMNKVIGEKCDPFLELDARSFLLRIYYETGNFTGLESLLNSFRSFLRRNNHLSETRLKNYKEFVRFYRRLVRLDPNKENLNLKLRQEITNSPYHTSREWFLEKLNKILPNTKSGAQGEQPENR